MAMSALGAAKTVEASPSSSADDKKTKTGKEQTHDEDDNDCTVQVDSGWYEKAPPFAARAIFVVVENNTFRLDVIWSSILRTFVVNMIKTSASNAGERAANVRKYVVDRLAETILEAIAFDAEKDEQQQQLGHRLSTANYKDPRLLQDSLIQALHEVLAATEPEGYFDVTSHSGAKASSDTAVAVLQVRHTLNFRLILF